MLFESWDAPCQGDPNSGWSLPLLGCVTVISSYLQYILCFRTSRSTSIWYKSSVTRRLLGSGLDAFCLLPMSNEYPCNLLVGSPSPCCPSKPYAHCFSVHVVYLRENKHVEYNFEDSPNHRLWLFSPVSMFTSHPRATGIHAC